MDQFIKDLFQRQQYKDNNFFLIAGPCVVESEEMVNQIGDKLASICQRLGIPLVLKASYRKANRTSGSSFTGVGDEKALEILKKSGDRLGLPVTSDVHAHEEARIA